MPRIEEFYLDKSNYTTDKYLAVINRNGLWIRDKVKDKILIASIKISEDFLINNFITNLIQIMRL